MFEAVFGGKNAIAPARCDLTQKVGLVSEQPEAVFHFPDDVKIAGIG